ncbi:MAG: YqeG family HAD IIIA-type phosphatase [Desulfobaccales bacterium]
MHLFNKDFFHNINLLLKPKLLLPSYEIDGLNALYSLLPDLKNVRGIIFDVDQTLIGFNRNTIDKHTEMTIHYFASKYKCCFLSNYPNQPYADIRLRNIERQIGIPIVRSKYKKPDPLAFKEALDALGTNINNTIVVGDRILTDILGANNFGMISILVKPINWKLDPVLMVTIPRIFEKILVRIINYILNINKNESN